MDKTTITILLVSGDANGLRTATISGWSGMAVAAPRTELDKLLARQELKNAGVYVLFSKIDDLISGLPRAYIGQAEVMCERLKRHKTEEFWISAIVFVGDKNFMGSHAKYLERQLICEAKEVHKFTLVNVQSSKATLPEAARPEVETFLFRIRQLLPLLGSELLTPVVQPGAKKPPGGTLFCKLKGAVARGYRTAGGFAVLQESTAVLHEKGSAEKHAPKVILRRKQLVDEGTLAQKDGFYFFTKDVEFSSPSAAAAVITGGTADGLEYWKTKDGQTLKQLEELA